MEAGRKKNHYQQDIINDMEIAINAKVTRVCYINVQCSTYIQ